MNNTGVLKVRRVFSLWGIAANWGVYIDKKRIGILSNDSELMVELTEGTYLIEITGLLLNFRTGTAAHEKIHIKQGDKIELDFSPSFFKGVELKNKNVNGQFDIEEKNNKTTKQEEPKKHLEFVKNFQRSEDIEIFVVEEFPIDNFFGNESIQLEQEFSKTATNEIYLEKNIENSLGLDAGILDFFKLKISESLTSKTGTRIGETVTRRHTIVLNVRPNERVKFVFVWKRKTISGDASFYYGSKNIVVPYTIKYDLTYELKTEKL